MAQKRQDGFSSAGRQSTVKTSAVYRGAPVKTFSHDLSNYSQIRRGLSPAMRAQTMTKTELKQVRPDLVERYINELNRWRESPQLSKTQRGSEIIKSSSADKKVQKAGQDPTQTIFREALKSGYYEGDSNAKAKLMTASLKLSMMSKKDARKEMMEGLNTKDRTRNQDFYKAEYYLDEGKFDPEVATTDMLREIVSSGYVDEKYPDQAAKITKEYMKRLSGTGEADGIGAQALANERASFMEDLVSIDETIIY